ncbi:MAG: putative ABC exporter domain-containing protein, partial [Clostridiales bacterium]
MKALLYLLLLNYKNTLRQLLSNPVKLIFTLCMGALLIFTIISSSTIPLTAGENYAPIGELTALTLSLYLLILVTTAKIGFSRGASFYTMSDVNILFTGPFASQKILLYGLIKQMGISLWVGVFLLFQYAWLHNRYGISFGDLVVIILGYCLVYFTAQLVAMAIYIFCAHNHHRRILLKYGFIASGVAVGIYLLYPHRHAEQLLPALVNAANQSWVNCLPVAGWLKASAAALINHNFSVALLWLLVWIGFVLLLIRLVSKSHTDFYEDVLTASEYSYQIRAAAQNGQIAENVPDTIKIGVSGFRHGHGATIFFFKHLRENRRTKLPFVDGGMLTNLVATVVFALFVKDQGLLPIFIFSTYMQIFSIAMGRWTKELLKPYIYLVPANNFHKLLGILAEGLLRNLIDAVLVFGVTGLVLRLSLPEIISCIIARFGFGLILLAANILSERTMGGINSKMLLLPLYFLLLLFIAAPGIILAVLLNEFWNISSLYGGLAISCIWNTAVAFIIILCCRNLL